MQCKNCGYPLWNLSVRRCPECGTGFRLEDFDFAPGSVRFCCPHCGEAVAAAADGGEGAGGEYVCAGCHARFGSDEVMVRPSDSAGELFLQEESAAWVRGRGGRGVAGWWTMAWGGMTGPRKLIRRVPALSSAGAAGSFAMWTIIACLGLGHVLSVLADMAVLGWFGATGSRGMYSGLWSMVMPMTAGALGHLAVEWVALALFLAVWGPVTQLMLRVTGGCAFSVRRTYHGLCYSAGPLLLLAVPMPQVVFGLMGQASWWWWFAGARLAVVFAWWLWCAMVMVAEGQRVHGGRAAVAVLTWPAVLLAGAVGVAAYVAWMLQHVTL